ncbi:MAG: hypothetical protein AB1695_13750 [Stygiobacter sp.]
MDDLIRILIFIIFVWSIIGGLKSDKKRKLPQNKLPQNYGGKEKKPLPSYNKLPEEILGEMFGIKIPKSEEYSESYETKDLEKEVVDLENSKQEAKTQWDLDYDKITFTDNLQKKDLNVSYEINQAEKVKLNYSKVIIDKLKNKSSLKDAIIISEILNKPKALRR